MNCLRLAEPTAVLPASYRPSCSPSGTFVLLDGDKIAALAAVYVRGLLSHAPAGTADSIRMGVVQTAYANGASTHYLTEKLGLEVGCTNTGEAVRQTAFQRSVQIVILCKEDNLGPGEAAAAAAATIGWLHQHRKGCSLLIPSESMSSNSACERALC